LSFQYDSLILSRQHSENNFNHEEQNIYPDIALHTQIVFPDFNYNDFDNEISIEPFEFKEEENAFGSI